MSCDRSQQKQKGKTTADAGIEKISSWWSYMKVSAFIFDKHYVNKEKVLRIPKIPLFAAVYHCKIVCLLDDLKNFTINLVAIVFWLILIDRAWRRLRQ